MDGDFRSAPQTEIDWAPQQVEALTAIETWFTKSDDQVFFLDGYAGTGKTTIAREVGRRIGGNVMFGAFTGRACAVMARKGCDPVDTIDSLIYTRRRQEYCVGDPPCKQLCPRRCRHKRERFLEKTLNPNSPVAEADLLIIDEVSMIGQQMGEDLLSFGVPTLVLGDTAQLPPIGDAGYFTNRKSDFQLTQVHRQALASPVIQLATQARQGKRLRCGDYGDSAVVSDIDDRDLVGFHQIICGTHRRRYSINRRCRRQLGFRGDLPEPGEKLVCLKNDRRVGLRNGELWWVESAKPDGRGFVEMAIRDEGQRTVEVVAPEAGFGRADGNGGELPSQPFDFGYVITAHKAQGSEWDSVLVLDESRVFRSDARPWLYTSITRAAERIVVVQP